MLIPTDRSFATEQAATDAAMADCSQYSGGSQCAVKQVFRNTCAAVARVIRVTRKSHYALQLEPTIRDAEEMALSECFQRNGRPLRGDAAGLRTVNGRFPIRTLGHGVLEFKGTRPDLDSRRRGSA
ncbi:MAG: DUF4189 domain-containing protein [Mesorhizobium sp.]|nr:MAG: DUF4189 domain-containing protein [Mesorhizobium sp.]